MDNQEQLELQELVVVLVELELVQVLEQVLAPVLVPEQIHMLHFQILELVLLA